MTNKEAIEQFKYAIDLIKQDGKDYLDERDIPMLKMAIKALEQEPKWIPVSERLPELDGDYLLFGKVVEDDTEDIFIGTYDACAEKFGYWEDYYDSKTLGFLDSELIEYNKVIAWKPLPEPYKAESENNNETD